MEPPHSTADAPGIPRQAVRARIHDLPSGSPLDSSAGSDQALLGEVSCSALCWSTPRPAPRGRFVVSGSLPMPAGHPLRRRRGCQRPDRPHLLGPVPDGGEHDRKGVKGLRILDSQARPKRCRTAQHECLGAGRDASPPAGHIWPGVSPKVTQAQSRAAQVRTRPLPERTKSTRDAGDAELMSTPLLTSAVDINGIRHLPTGSDTRRCQIGRSQDN